MATSSRDIQAQATRDRVLATALECIDEFGESGLRVADVAERSGVSVGTLYHHFADRDALVVAVRLHQFQGTMETDVAAVRYLIETAPDAASFAKAMAEMAAVVSSPERVSMRWQRVEIIGSASGRPELAAALSKEQHENTSRLEELAVLAQKRKLIDPALNPRTLMIFVQSYIFGLVLSDIDTVAPFDQDAWIAVVRRFIDSITTFSSE